MPWDTKTMSSLREEFIDQVNQKNQNISSLCHQYNISRKTAYKWLKRYKEEGFLGLEDRSKRPSRVKVTDNEWLELILKTRDEWPAWGGRKLRQYLLNLNYSDVPSEPTFNRILKKHGYITKEASEKRERFIRFEREKPNELWQMDFKGHFQIDEGRCHPLTVLDDHSRFSLCLKACLSENESSVKAALTEVFREYGLPDAMTMDNGAPWKGSHPWRFSQLTIWLMRQGIKVSHSRPGHPQTQGKDERFHRTLKEELLRFYQFKDLKNVQEHFDDWRYKYNHIRPHEGINMRRPFERYISSSRHFSEVLHEIVYEEQDEVRKVQRNGVIEFKGNSYFIGEHLYRERVAVRPTREDGIYEVYYCKTRVNKINLKF